MDKGTKKRSEFNGHAIRAVAAKFDVSEYYTRQSVNGKKTGVMPDTLKKEYKKACAELDAATKKAIEKFTQN